MWKFTAVVLAILGTMVRLTAADTFTIYAQSLADTSVTGWDYETNILGAAECAGCSDCCFRDTPAPSRIQCSAGAPNGYVDVQLVINGWTSWTRPAGHVVTQVTVSIFGAFAGGVSGNMYLRFNGANRVQRTVSGNCGWEPAYDITFLQPDGWSNAEINGLDVSIARVSSSPSATLHVDAVRLVVTTAGTGACCFASGACSILTSADCAGQAGSYQGDNVACSTCPQPTGACCLSCGQCSVLTSVQCSQQSGAYGGNFVACNPCTVPTGACCFTSTGACSLLTQSACAAQSGVWQGCNVACSACPQPGACCFASGACSILTSAQCAAQAGSYRGNNVACNPCQPLGACCFFFGDCILLTASECSAGGGQYRGNGVACDPCEAQGACCLPALQCVNTTAADCQSRGGYFVEFESCTTTSSCSSSGACCFNGGVCTFRPRFECEQSQGAYLGDGAACNLCSGPVGGCCLPGFDSYCEVRQQSSCVFSGGVFRGAGSTCDAGCSPYFCCRQTGCSLGDVTDCQSTGGWAYLLASANCNSCTTQSFFSTSAPTADGLFTSTRSSTRTGVSTVRVSDAGVLTASAETSGGLGPPLESASASAAITLYPNGLGYSTSGSISVGVADPPITATVFAGGFALLNFPTDVIVQPSRPLSAMQNFSMGGRSPIASRLFAGTYDVSARVTLQQTGAGSQTQSDAGSIMFIPSTCRPDVDGAVGLTVNDLFAFLAAFFGPTGADYNQSNRTSVEDLFAYLADYFAGCP